MVVDYSNVQMLHGLAAELWRQNSFDQAFETMFNASCVLQELDEADKLEFSLCHAVADVLDDMACMKELLLDFEEAYNYQWLRLKILTGLEDPMQQDWTIELLEAGDNPSIAHAYSALSTILLAKAKKVRSQDAYKAAVFFSDAMNVLRRCHMFEDNQQLMQITKLEIVSCLKAVGRKQDAHEYNCKMIELVTCTNITPEEKICWTAEKIFHRPKHGGPPFVMPLDDDVACGPAFVAGHVVHDPQKKERREIALNCLRSIGADKKAFKAKRLEENGSAAKAFAAKKLEADRVFEELLQEEESKIGGKDKRMSKRKARRLQKAQGEQAAADAGSKPSVSPAAAQDAEQAAAAEDPEQKYRAALESLDVSLQCSLTLATMKDPVVTQYGHSFERKEIELWFKTNNTCPMTGVAVTSKALVPNHALRAVIAAAEALKEAKNCVVGI